MKHPAVSFLFALFTPLFPARALADSCTDLMSAQIAGATITAATDVPAGSFTSPQQVGLPPVQFNVPAFCRVQLTLAPEIVTEVWLPAAWNGNFAGWGNGGELGGIIYTLLGYGVIEGYAGVASDLGHESYSADASWALNQPQLVEEFGYTATHDMTVAAKSLVQIYYGTTPGHSYFYGSSAGGRQALMEAERYPADYGGIISVSPGQNWTNLASGMIGEELKLGASGSSSAQLTDSQALTLNNAVIAACDALDGVRDGLITDPTKCHFDPGVLACPNQKSALNCLSDVQVAAVRALYQPLTRTDGTIIYGGLPYGSEYEWFCSVLHDAFNFPFADSWYQNEVYSNPDWDFTTFNVDVDPARAAIKLGRTENASSADLDQFRAGGGKLLITQGESDAIVVPQNTIAYYETILARYKKTANSFTRLLMEPGVGHCGQGPGPDDWDPFAAMVNWVENGVAPDSIIAYRLDKKGNVNMSRPLCPWPKQPVYSGHGDIDEAKNFSCRKPPN